MIQLAVVHLLDPHHSIRGTKFGNEISFKLSIFEDIYLRRCINNSIVVIYLIFFLFGFVEVDKYRKQVIPHPKLLMRNHRHLSIMIVQRK